MVLPGILPWAPKLAIVPVGKVANLKPTSQIELRQLEGPDLAGVRYDGVVADLRAGDLSPEWEKFLARCTLAHIPVYHVTQIRESITGRVEITHLSENEYDALLRLKALKAEQARMIRGSGVALEDYPCEPEPEGKPVVVMAARLLKDKGVLEYVEAARLLKQRGLSIEIRLIGSLDPGNPTSVTQQELDQWAAEGWVELLGFRKDIAAQYAAANIVCLPSYREGLPKGLVEAAACGRAVVTTDVPGCRDAITPNVTGLLVPIKDSVALADTIQKLIEAPKLRKQMGQAGRVLAEEVFTIEKIVQQHMNIYRELLES